MRLLHQLKSLSNHINSLQSHHFLLSYEGEIDLAVLNASFDAVEKGLEKLSEPLKLRRKVYNVMVEVLQNLYQHKLERVPEEFKRTFFSVSKDHETYHIFAANFLEKKFCPALKEKIDSINAMKEEDVINEYRKVLDNGIISDKGGSGLGFLDMARKTKNKLKYEFIEQDNFCLFILHLTINV